VFDAAPSDNRIDRWYFFPTGTPTLCDRLSSSIGDAGGHPDDETGDICGRYSGNL